jgi:hypothetical protein
MLRTWRILKLESGGNVKTANRNATKCGIFAKILLSGEAMGEAEQDFLALLSGLRKQFRPANSHEDVLVDKLAYLYLRLSRVYKSDIRLVGKLFAKVDQALEVDREPIESQFVGEKHEFEAVTFSKGPSPDLVIRYEANTDRQIVRTLDLLERLQRNRQRPSEPPRDNSGTDANRPE